MDYMDPLMERYGLTVTLILVLMATVIYLFKILRYESEKNIGELNASRKDFQDSLTNIKESNAKNTEKMLQIIEKQSEILHDMQISVIALNNETKINRIILERLEKKGE